MSAYTQTLTQIRGQRVLRTLLLRNGADFAANATNYWTVEVRAFDGTGPGNGVVLGAFDGATKALFADPQHPFTFYDSERGTILTDGTVLRATITSTGSPAALSHPVISARFNRTS